MTDAADAAAVAYYDRWTLRDPNDVSYGYFSGPNNSTGGDYPPMMKTKAKTKTSGTRTTTAIVDDDDGNRRKKGGMKKGFYLTTAINYTNGPAHMGHAYEGVTSDAIARYARLVASHREDGDGGTATTTDTAMPYFVTGADEHGEKIAKTAESEGKDPIDVCDKVRRRRRRR
jgi:hypothetical protein